MMYLRPIIFIFHWKTRGNPDVICLIIIIKKKINREGAKNSGGKRAGLLPAQVSTQAAFHVGPGWAPVGHSWAPVGPDWGPFGNAAWVQVSTGTRGTGSRLLAISVSVFTLVSRLRQK